VHEKTALGHAQQGAPADGAVQQLLGHRVTQGHFPFLHAPDRFDDLVRGLALVDVTQRGPERTLGVERLASDRDAG